MTNVDDLPVPKCPGCEKEIGRFLRVRAWNDGEPQSSLRTDLLLCERCKTVLGTTIPDELQTAIERFIGFDSALYSKQRQPRPES